MQSSALLYSLHLKRIHRQARRLHTTHTRATSSALSTLGNKSCYCPPHGEVIESTDRRGGGDEGRTGTARQRLPQIRSSCIVVWNFRWHQKMFYFPLVWRQKREGVILIETQSRYSQPGPVTGLVEGTTTGRAKKISPAHSSRLLKSMLLPPVTVTASVSSSSSHWYEEAAGNTHSIFLGFFLWNHTYFCHKVATTPNIPIRKMKFKKKVSQSNFLKRSPANWFKRMTWAFLTL